jgi:hypothetical protein
MARYDQNFGFWRADGVPGVFKTKAEALAAEATPPTAPPAESYDDSDFANYFGTGATDNTKPLTMDELAAASAVKKSNELFKQGYQDLNGDGKVTDADVKLNRTPYGTPTEQGGTASTQTVTTQAGVVLTGSQLAAASRAWDNEKTRLERIITEGDNYVADRTVRGQSVNSGVVANTEAARKKLAALGPRPGGPAPIDNTTGSQDTPANPNAGVSANDVLDSLETSVSGTSRAPTLNNPGGSQGPTNTGAPQLDTGAINSVLSDVDAMRSYIFGLAGDKKDYSVAEAQLRSASDAAQRHTLGQARGGNRRDRAMLERQAIAEGAAIEQAAGRDTALLRAQEEDQDRRFRADVASKAAELGLNETAYLVDISKANLDSVNNLLNNEFQQLGLDKQLSVQEAAQILAFTQGMAGIQFDYDKLSVDDQNTADALLMQKYGIDQGTYLALKQMKDARKLNWNQLLTTIVAGGAQGATMAIGAEAFK